ncbi:hypothetical protein AB4Y92_14355 [Lysobacter sp. TAB13]
MPEWSRPMKLLIVLPLLSCVLALTACAHAGPAGSSAATGGSSGGASETVRAGQSVSLQPGHSVVLSDRSQLRFVAVTSDSRCKPNVQCIWAGEAVLEFQWTGADGQSSALSFNSGNAPSKSAGAWTFELQSLDFADPPTAKLLVNAK